MASAKEPNLIDPIHQFAISKLADIVDVSGALETNKVKDILKIKNFLKIINKIKNED